MTSTVNIPTDNLGPELIKAARLSNVAALKQLLGPTQNHRASNENDLRIALQRASDAGNEAIVKVLLDGGAKTDLPSDKGLPPLYRAVDKGHLNVVDLLLRAHANTEGTGKFERTALICAALKGHNSILKRLLDHKADVNAVDRDGRSVLHNLAADVTQPRKWNDETLGIILSTHINRHHVDKLGRTALHWAAVTGKLEFARTLLTDPRSNPWAHVSASTDRSRTALHFAAENNHPDLVELLLEHGSDKEARSDGNWTPLLNAARDGHSAVVDFLLKAGSQVNARTSTGMTALHWAAENGHIDVVKRILQEEKASKNSKDSFDSTPLARAIQHREQEKYRLIIEELKPHIFGGSLSPDAKEACQKFKASVVDFFVDDKAPEKDKNVVKRLTVHDVLYAINPKDKEVENQRFSVSTSLKDVRPKPPSFRWIHLPANNVQWAEAVITKFFLERDGADVAGFKSMLRTFSQQQHRGNEAHSRFMRPLCQRFWNGQVQPDSTTRFGNKPALDGRASPTKIRESRASSLARHLNPSRNDSVVVIFMPYLHWATDQNRAQQSDVIKRVRKAKNNPYLLGPSATKDESLIRGYLNSSTGLHVRRTLDQFYHHSINTDRRDTDQVVYRYCDKINKELKIYMVDQMWIWILSNNLVLTSFPERWGQPKRDPVNIFDGLVEDLNSKTRPPVRSPHELVALITDRCTGAFDRHQWGNDDFLFLEMFELSIGTLTRRETALFKRFERDSAAAAHYLETNDKASRFYDDEFNKEHDAEDLENEEDLWLKEGEEDKKHVGTNRFVDRLLNIAKEAELLVECKDIQDELGIISTILRQQKSVLHDMEPTLKACLPDDEKRMEISKKLSQQQKVVDLHLLDIDRMAKQAKSVYTSLSHVLDLKQKHANALEAHFMRDQAQDTARQGQTIMVFTIVTIIFLPLSFMASFFAINVIEFPHESSNGGNGLHLSFVSRYIFGIGFGVTVPLIGIAFIMGDVQGWILDYQRRIKSRRGGPADHPGNQEHSRQKGIDDMEKPRNSVESFPYKPPARIETDATERSRRTEDLEAG